MPFCFLSCGRRVKEFRIIDDNLEYSETYGDYVVIPLDENGEAVYEIKYELSPKSNRIVEFEYDYKADCVKGNGDGVIKFTGVGSVMVTLSVGRKGEVLKQATLFVVAANI